MLLLTTDFVADVIAASATGDLIGWAVLAALFLGYILYGATKQ